MPTHGPTGLSVHTIHPAGRARNVRVVWVEDPHYEPDHVCGNEKETAACMKELRDNLASGKWAALGCIVERKCHTCGEWQTVDDLWGIVIEPELSKLKQFALENMDFSKRIKRA